MFSCVQGLEYGEARFTISDRVYGSTFFLITGFHGFHVLVGTIFLGVRLVRRNLGHFSPGRHLGFEFAA